MSDSMVDTRNDTKVRAWVAKSCSPRGAMTLMLMATTATGSIASYVLLHLGVSHFGIRYGLSVLAAYAALLGLIGLWSRYEMRRMEGGAGSRGGGGDVLDLVDGNGSGGSISSGGGSGGGGSAARFGGGGGRFGGAGASGAYDSDTPSAPMAVASSSGKSGGGGGFSPDLDGDELVVVILIVLAVAAAVLAAGYIIWIAPGFLGDVMAASVAGAGISHRITRHDPGWMGLVVKRTALPAVAVLVLFTGVGFALQSYAPGARTLHGAWQAHLDRHAIR